MRHGVDPDHLAAVGQESLANRLRAEHLSEMGRTDEAARFFEAAGEYTRAAELGAKSGDRHHSATLFQEAGEFEKAAASYAEAGDMRRAAEAYEAAYDYDRAIDAYRAVGDATKLMELLEKTGRWFEAAVVADEQEDVERAIRNRQQVDLRDPDYAESTERLAAIFAERGEWGFAVEKLRTRVQGAGGAKAAPLDLLERLAGYEERAGELQRALATCEEILRRDFTYPGIEERVKALRERASEMAAATQSAARTRVAGARAMDDRYELEEEIGRGGMGVVYRARDKRLGRIVALKQLPDNLRDHPTAVQLFLREARSAAALNHPNIVTLFDADQTEDDYYLTMEYLEGMPLDRILRKRQKLAPRDVIRLGVQISRGLQYAHQSGIVHRDIKTSNLFFTRDKTVKIMDFGLAKMVEEVRRAATVIGGTPFYMAPEQAAGKPVDHRADLYAFGVTLFELLTGRVPFHEGDVARHHRETPPPDPCALVPGVPEGLAELILELMAKEPDDRPGSTALVTQRLEALAA